MDDALDLIFMTHVSLSLSFFSVYKNSLIKINNNNFIFLFVKWL